MCVWELREGASWPIRSGRRICHLASSWIRERGENVKWKEGAGKKTKKAGMQLRVVPGLGFSLTRRRNSDLCDVLARMRPRSHAGPLAFALLHHPRDQAHFPFVRRYLRKGMRVGCRILRSPTRHCPPFVFARGPGVLPSYIPPPATSYQLRAIRVPPLSRDRVSHSSCSVAPP